jgi:hypothetical protein
VLALDLAEVRELRVEVEDLQPRGTLSRADALPPPTAAFRNRTARPLISRDKFSPARMLLTSRIVRQPRVEFPPIEALAVPGFESTPLRQRVTANRYPVVTSFRVGTATAERQTLRPRKANHLVPRFRHSRAGV